MTESYDIIIIGGGPGGYVAAIRAAQLGARVALVEKERIGGTCLNRGCIPTKALLRSVEAYLTARRATEYGIDIEGAVRPNFGRMMARKDEVTEALVASTIELVKARKVRVYDGTGTILRPGRVRVGEQEISSTAIIIATGSVPARVSIPGSDLPGVITSRELLRLTELPESMVVIGASVVGLEFASMFAALGCRVSVVGRRTFMKATEPRLAKRFRSMLARSGVKVTIGVDFRAIVPTDDGALRVVYEQRGKEAFAEGQVVLLSTGRWPYTDGLGVDNLGLRMDGRRILTNGYLETNVPGVYAIGDVLGTYMLAHSASYEGEVAVENALGHRRAADYRAVPYGIFTLPEVAGVGLTEAEAKEQGIDYVVARFPFAANGKALCLGETGGQVRLVCEKGEKGRVLGAHIMGFHAADLIAELTLAIRLGATAQQVAETIHIHPTLSEAVMEAAKAAAFGEAIHYRKTR